MHIKNGSITIRNATSEDALQLCAWWNDGKIMAHAGFPLGLGTTIEGVCDSIASNSDDTMRLHIIEFNGKAIGEIHYRNKGDGIAQIGIKICDESYQEKGLGTSILGMFIKALFYDFGYKKIILDTNFSNLRAQHVYEKKLGFKKIGVRENCWSDQLGKLQSAVDYELTFDDWRRTW